MTDESVLDVVENGCGSFKKKVESYYNDRVETWRWRCV